MAQIHTKRLVRTQLANNLDRAQGEVGVDPPVARRVGVRERVARDLAANSHVRPLRGLPVQARFDVP